MRVLLLAAVFLVSAGCDLDDWPGPTWMSRDAVVQKLQALGYTNITGLEADDGHWEGKGVKNGRIVEFHVDPHSGVVIKEQLDD